MEWRGGGEGVELGHGVVQDQATFDGLEAIGDERGDMSSTQRVDGGGTVEAQSDMARMMERLSRATESVLVVAR